MVVGINKYSHGLPPLRTAVDDASRVGSTLRALGFSVTLILDGAATLRRLREHLGHTLTNTQPDDQVLIYFAGHGETIGRDTPMGYLVPVDAQKKRIASTALSMQELVGWMKSYPAKRTLLVADACYSGLATLPLTPRSVRAVHNSLECNQPEHSVTAALVAGRADDKAYETAEGGVFTQEFLNVLTRRASTGHAKQNSISHLELGAHLSRTVEKRVRTEFSAIQVPQVYSSGPGLFQVPITTPLAEIQEVQTPNDSLATPANQGPTPIPSRQNGRIRFVGDWAGKRRVSLDGHFTAEIDNAVTVMARTRPYRLEVAHGSTMFGRNIRVVIDDVALVGPNGSVEYLGDLVDRAHRRHKSERLDEAFALLQRIVDTPEGSTNFGSVYLLAQTALSTGHIPIAIEAATHATKLGTPEQREQARSLQAKIKSSYGSLTLLAAPGETNTKGLVFIERRDQPGSETQRRLLRRERFRLRTSGVSLPATLWLPVGQYWFNKVPAEVLPSTEVNLEIFLQLSRSHPDEVGLGTWTWVGIGLAAALVAGTLSAILLQDSDRKTVSSGVQVMEF